MNKYVKILVGVPLVTVLIYLCGAMCEYFPFLFIREMDQRIAAFSTLVLSITIAICTCILLSEQKKR